MSGNLEQYSGDHEPGIISQIQAMNPSEIEEKIKTTLESLSDEEMRFLNNILTGFRESHVVYREFELNPSNPGYKGKQMIVYYALLLLEKSKPGEANDQNPLPVAQSPVKSPAKAQYDG